MPTITEALAEIKTINNRIHKKRESIGQYLILDSRIRDPHEDIGGTATFIERERQAIKDLELRKVFLRIAINSANTVSYVTVNTSSMSVAEWLIWRREVAPERKSFLSALVSGIQKARKEIQSKGGNVTGFSNVNIINNKPDGPPNGLVFLNETELAEEIDELTKTLGELDGRLSMFNATTLI